MEPRRAPNGRRYLNVGCGAHFSREWTNLDQRDGDDVLGHDLRKPLPFPDACFDAVYSSHVLEHFTPEMGRRFLWEQWRVLKPGGVCRVVVPDLERLCRDYLWQLEKAAQDPAQVLDYQWTVLQLIDQMVREDCGGEMLRVLRERRFNPGFVRRQVGDEAADFLDESTPAARTQAAPATALQGVKGKVKRWLGRNARSQGEAHRWMYDRLSLRLVMEEAGFSGFRVVTHLESSLPDWDRYHLDTSRDGSGPRKPDSLFAEAFKPA
jgi:predicted SAM-dependent methyltransferase